MPKINYVEHDGRPHAVEAKSGQSVMEAAVKNGVSGITADCGGACACATCHVYVDADWLERTGVVSAMERAMLDFANEVETNSRLACQIRISDALDGLIVRMPETQQLY